MDIVFTANREWMDYLNEKKHVDSAAITPFAYNTLVFVGKGAPRVSHLDELGKLEKVAVGSPKSVPAGEYAMEALRNAGIDKQLDKKLVMARDVRDCLVYAERGEADGAFVYRTDALLSKEVTIWFTVPQEPLLQGRLHVGAYRLRSKEPGCRHLLFVFALGRSQGDFAEIRL